MMSSEYIIEMKNITKTFPGIVANDNVSLQIKKGEIFALLGENGAGKSTIMSVLFGMYTPDSGEIYVRGKEEKILSPNYATKLNIGMVHQHFKLVENYSVTENIILGLPSIKTRRFGLPFVDLNKHHDEVEELSKRYGLEVNPRDIIENLTVSIQQRVEILKMLYREAEILIFDEPTAVLTPQEISFLLEIIKGLRDAGKTIILITHKLDEIKEVADRCAILSRGKLMEVRDVSDTSTQEMARLMVGREVLFSQEKNPENFGETVLSVKNLTVENRDGFPVIKDLSFSIRGGEVFAVAGVSGNGQVELADTIAGLEKAKEGSITLNQQEMTTLSIRQRTETGLSYIPEDRQRYGLLMEFSLAENLGLKRYYKSPFSKKGFLKPKEFDDYATKLIEDFDIRCAQGGKTPVRSMSGGNQQKAIIAREIQEDSPLIIFVQPTRGLDIGAIENVHKQILALRDQGKAVLLISLELEEIMRCADTIGVIYNGSFQKIAPAKELTVQEVGEFMIGGKE
ncbi:MAG: ABC transporter ATP-binding protein [Eubacteriales bacterium]